MVAVVIAAIYAADVFLGSNKQMEGVARGLGALGRMKNKAIEIKCRSNLKSIAWATLDWALDADKNVTDKVSLDDIQDALGPIRPCGAEGKYILTTVQEAPTCSAGHSLEKDSIDSYYDEDMLNSIRENYQRAQEKK